MDKNTIYVILHNDELHLKCANRTRKAAYLTEGSAKSVVTTDAEHIARDRYEVIGQYWHELSSREKNARIDQVRQEFQIVPYAPVK